MGIPTSLSRLTDYYWRYGLRATIRRTVLATKRALVSSHSVVFYCDLSRLGPPAEELPKSLSVERKRSVADLGPRDLDAIISIWNPRLAVLRMKERFALGASLWLIRFKDQLAGYGWTLQGRTVEAHYFPLGAEDVHLFDFYVLSEFRGQGMNPLLVNCILRGLAADRGGRAFIEAAEWNYAQLSSLRRTSFRCLGRARKITILGCPIIYWRRNTEAEERRDARLTTKLYKRPEAKDLM